MYKSERWAPLPIPVDVFLIALETTENLKTLLGATSVRVAYNKGGTILVEWTMMHRETFAGLVGQYIVRKPSGEFQILDSDELMSLYAPFVEEKDEDEGFYNGMDKLGKISAVYEHAGVIEEILFELPDGSPATFRLKSDKEEPEVYEVLEEAKSEDIIVGDLGKLLAVHTHDGVVTEALFELPDGKPATFVVKMPIDKERPVPGPPKNYNKEKN